MCWGDAENPSPDGARARGSRGGKAKRDGDADSLWPLLQIHSHGRILADVQIQNFIQNSICRDQPKALQLKC